MNLVEPPLQSVHVTHARRPILGRASSRDVAVRTRDIETVVTQAILTASPDEIWRTLLFYEEIVDPPPLLLRLLLPVPLRAEGRKSNIGDESRCMYSTGHLVKRITRVDRARRLAFDVVEQRLHLAGGVALVGGSYTLRELEDGRTEIELATSHASSRRPRWIRRRVERMIAHMFHRHILRAIRRELARSAQHGGALRCTQ